MSNWKRLSTNIVHNNEWKTFHEDEVIRPDGRQVTYSWVETPPAEFVVAVNEDNKVCLVQQERYTTGMPSWELPGGHTDGEAEMDAGKRELALEAGLHADHWERMPGEMYPFIGTAASRNIVFVATGLHKVRHAEPDTGEVITAVKWFGWDELKDMMKAGELTDGQTVAALMLAGLHLGKIK
jgi:8-oxo-dGDP phosphatase